MNKERLHGFSRHDQLMMIGSEIFRAMDWQYKDEKISKHMLDRALEYINGLIDDPKWAGKNRAMLLGLQHALQGCKDGTTSEGLESVYNAL